MSNEGRPAIGGGVTFRRTTMMGREQPNYRAYLLRLWQVRVSGVLVWRASLEDARTSSRLGFDSVEALCRYLQRHDDAPPAGCDRVEVDSE
jgi:hypothetical protein